MRVVFAVLSVLFLFAFLGCNKNQTVPSEKVYLVGIAKIIAHPALDAVEQGIIDELREQGIKVRFDLQNANGEFGTAGSIAAKFKGENVDVAVGIATPVALALANTLKTTPVVFSAVTDPISAGLRATNDQESTNITGVSDMTPVAEQIKLMHNIKPLKTLGHIYNAGEANSVKLLELAEAACKELGIKLVTATATTTADVRSAAEFLASKKVDAIYISTDNTVVSALASVIAVMERAGIPIVSADPSSATPGGGVLLAYGVDYYKTGRATGKMVAEILRGAKPGDIPVKYMAASDEVSYYIDKERAEKLGLAVVDR